MDKDLLSSNFVNWDKYDKDMLCGAMDMVLGEAARKGDSIQHIADVIKSLYEQYPGLEEYKWQRFREACPNGNAFDQYMPIIGVDCMPAPTYAKAIESNNEADTMNDTQSIRKQIRRIQDVLTSIENKLPAYDIVSKAADDMPLMGIGDSLCHVLSELEGEILYIYKNPKQEVLGMARVGFTPDKYEVYVNTNDGGKIPHFHYRDANDWNKFHTCIRIDRAEYFLHEGKEDKLNAKQLRSLYRFLKSDVTIAKYKDKFKNNYELICFLWDLNNSDIQLPEDIQMPDYLHDLNV